MSLKDDVRRTPVAFSPATIDIVRRALPLVPGHAAPPDETLAELLDDVVRRVITTRSAILKLEGGRELWTHLGSLVPEVAQDVACRVPTPPGETEAFLRAFQADLARRVGIGRHGGLSAWLVASSEGDVMLEVLSEDPLVVCFGERAEIIE